MASTVRGDARCIQCMVHSIHECPFTFLYLKAIKANIGFSGQLISFTLGIASQPALACLPSPEDMHGPPPCTHTNTQAGDTRGQ